VGLDAPSVPAGKVTINATNAGTVVHEMLVVRSDVAKGGLPIVDNRIPEDDIDVIGEIPELDAGAKSSGHFVLEPGRYLLICNVPSHYGRGMVTELTVTG
jgi:uncharacterized cupredoxin-like copper-binding protein